MVTYIETKYTLEIAKRFWLSQDYKRIEVPIYEIILRDQKSKKVLNERRVHHNEILTHVEDILPLHFNQIKSPIKQEFNLS